MICTAERRIKLSKTKTTRIEKTCLAQQKLKGENPLDNKVEEMKICVCKLTGSL
jgi:hypothetical protein